MIKDIEIELNVDFFEKKEYYEKISNKILFTGMIDRFYNYKHGKLEYRSLKFENEILDMDNFQGNSS